MLKKECGRNIYGILYVPKLEYAFFSYVHLERSQIRQFRKVSNIWKFKNLLLNNILFWGHITRRIRKVANWIKIQMQHIVEVVEFN